MANSESSVTLPLTIVSGFYSKKLQIKQTFYETEIYFLNNASKDPFMDYHL